MDLIEENKHNKNDETKRNFINKNKRPHHEVYAGSKSKLFELKDRRKEIIHDKCQYVVYIIDNSESMEYYNDGKIFEKDKNNKIIKTNRFIIFESFWIHKLKHIVSKIFCNYF